jgi:hypothetical protein
MKTPIYLMSLVLLLGGLYSFVENFGPNGNDHFAAHYGNQWICSTTGVWTELRTASFSTTADPVKHPRYDYGGAVSGVWMYMFSGGFRYFNSLQPGGQLQRNSSGKHPDVDFSKLPEN